MPRPKREAYPCQSFRKAVIADRNRSSVRGGSSPKHGWFEELLESVGLDALEEVEQDEIDYSRYKMIGVDISDPIRPELLLKYRYSLILKTFATTLGEIATATDAAQKKELAALVRASKTYEDALRSLSGPAEQRIRAAAPDAFNGLCDWDPGRDIMHLADRVLTFSNAARAALDAMGKPKGTRPAVDVPRKQLILALGFMYDFFCTMLNPPDTWDAAVSDYREDFMQRDESQRRQMQGTGSLPEEIALYRAKFVSEILKRHEDPAQKEYKIAPLPPQTFRDESEVLNVLGRTWSPLK